MELFDGRAGLRWWCLIASERDGFNLTAFHKRSIAEARATPLDECLSTFDESKPEEGPWGLSSRTGEFALRPQVVGRAQDKYRTMSAMERAWLTGFETMSLPPRVPRDGAV